MSLTDIQTIKQTDCVGDSRTTINNNFQTLVSEISAVQNYTILAKPKGTRGTLIVGDGLLISNLGVLALDFNADHFKYNNIKQLCLSDTILNSTFVKTTGGTVTGGLSITGNGSVGINTSATTLYKLDVNGASRFRSRVLLPSHSNGSLTYIDEGTGNDATYSTYNTVLYVSKGLAIKSTSGVVNIVLNSATGDITTRGAIRSSSVNTSTILGDVNSGNGDILINRGITVEGNGTVVINGLATTTTTLLSTEDNSRIATTRFVQTNLNEVKETLNSVPSLYVKKTDNTIVTGYITTPPPFLPGHVANKQYVDTEIAKVTDIGDKLNVISNLTTFLTIKIDKHPISTRINEGSAVALSARALPNDVSFMPVNYQWKRNNISIIGANADTYYATISGIYTCLCTNIISQTATSAAQVDVNYRVLLASGKPASTTLTSTTQTRVLTAVVQAGTPPYTYKWFKYNNLISGATNNIYSVTTGGNYNCLVGNMVNEAWSNTSVVGVQILLKVVAFENRSVQVLITSVFHSIYSVNISGQTRNVSNNTTVTFTNVAEGINTLIVTSPDSLAAAINITVPIPGAPATTIDQNIVLVPTT